MIQHVTGWEVTTDELLTVGERRLNMLRAFNAREGIGPDSDVLPPFILQTANAEGGRITREELEVMVGEYNRIRKARDD